MPSPGFQEGESPVRCGYGCCTMLQRLCCFPVDDRQVTVRAFSATLLIRNSYLHHSSSKPTVFNPPNGSAALALPKGWGLDSVIGSPAELQLQLADLERFEDKHNEKLGFHARNIMAVAPEVRVPSQPPGLVLQQVSRM